MMKLLLIIINNYMKMAGIKRLYPTLPSINTSLVVSSDEEDEINRVRRVSEVTSTEYRLPTSRPMKNSDTISLNEFEASHKRKSKPRTSLSSKQISSYPKPRSSKVLLDVVKWVWYFMYKWRLVLAGLLLGLVAVLLMDEQSGKDNLLDCSPHRQPCIRGTELKHILPLAKKVQTQLHITAGNYICGKSNNRNLTVSELISLLKQNYPHIDITFNDMKQISYLFLYNSHWGISIFKPDGPVILDHNLELTDEDIMESSKPRKTLACKINEVLQNIWSRLKLAMFVAVCATVIFVLIYWYIQRQKESFRSVYLMVDNIIEVLKAHHHKSQNNPNILPYVAIVHVRDMLIPPSERENKNKIWEDAVKLMATKESRVRVETRRIAGEDFTVWRWIHKDPPPTEEPDSIIAPVDSSAWPGRAFEDYPPGLENKVAPPLGNPSPCIRLKNMFEHIKHMPENQIHDIQNSVLHRCSQYGTVVHIYVDKRSIHGCVYFKMDSLKSAIAMYKILHGSWFKGRLITAKYIPESKYYKWFPKSVKAVTPIVPH